MISQAKYKAIHGVGINIVILKQMLQRLPIALAQVKAGNTSEKLLNKINQIIYFLYCLYWVKKTAKKYIIM